MLTGIALGTVVVVGGYHLARVVARAAGTDDGQDRSSVPAAPTAARRPRTTSSHVKPAPFAYRRPRTLDDAVAELAGTPGAKVLAGGQSLVPLLSMRLAAPSTLVDINALPDLDHVRCSADGVRVGALARHAAVLASTPGA